MVVETLESAIVQFLLRWEWLAGFWEGKIGLRVVVRGRGVS
jgi:hypothetical protein